MLGAQRYWWRDRRWGATSGGESRGRISVFGHSAYSDECGVLLLPVAHWRRVDGRDGDDANRSKAGNGRARRRVLVAQHNHMSGIRMAAALPSPMLPAQQSSRLSVLSTTSSDSTQAPIGWLHEHRACIYATPRPGSSTAYSCRPTPSTHNCTATTI